MHSSRLIKRCWYHYKLGRGIFVLVMMYFFFFMMVNIFFQTKWNLEYFSILNQLLMPLLSCMWMNACLREWVESNNKEILFFYCKMFVVRQLLDILMFHTLMFFTYFILCYYGYEKFENIFVEISVCFLFQTVYCFGILIMNSPVLMLFIIVFVEIVNTMAYLKNIGNGWYLFLKTETIQSQQAVEKYVWFFVVGALIWGVYLIVYSQKKNKGSLWS